MNHALDRLLRAVLHLRTVGVCGALSRHGTEAVVMLMRPEEDEGAVGEEQNNDMVSYGIVK